MDDWGHVPESSERSHRKSPTTEPTKLSVTLSEKSAKPDCKFCFEDRPCAIHRQVGGNHYQMPIEPLEFIMANNLPYCEANVIKYTCRHERKNGAEDIQKAIHYLQLILRDKYSIDS